MKNEILRSAKARYHFICTFFYKINKGDLPLMYFLCFLVRFHRFSCFLGVLLCDLCHSLYIKGKSPIFIS